MHPYSNAAWTDNMLMDLIQNEDDRAAFAEVYRRYWQPMIDTAFQRLKSIEVAEEIIQDVFVSMFIRRKEIRLQSNLEAYLKTALKYKIYNTYRSQQTHLDHLDAIISASDIKPPMPDALLEAKELRERITRVASKMPDKCREVFLLSRLDQLSHQAIADKLEISVSTVKKHITKAIRIMKIEFQDHQGDLLAICMLVYLAR